MVIMVIMDHDLVFMDIISIFIQLTSPPLRICRLNLVSPHGLDDVHSCHHVHHGHHGHHVHHGQHGYHVHHGQHGHHSH